MNSTFVLINENSTYRYILCIPMPSLTRVTYTLKERTWLRTKQLNLNKLAKCEPNPKPTGLRAKRTTIRFRVKQIKMHVEN